LRGLLVVTPSLSISQAYGWYKALRTDEVKLDAIAVNMADLRDTDTKFSVPVFFIQGENDNVAPTSLVADYLAKIQAPAKGLDVVPDAGHFVMWTHPREFLSALREDMHRFTTF
ncbi:MAG: alpha/beta fold hydrolase, partial [Candidatus Sulfotelmatobacter sp.]